MKTEQSTEKAREHNGSTVFLHVSTGGSNSVFYLLSSINFISSLFAPTYFFASASNRVHCSLGLGGHSRAYNRITPLTVELIQYNNDDVPCCCLPLLQPPHHWGHIRHRPPTPPTKIPHPPTWKIFFRYWQWVESTMSFPLYYYDLIPLYPSLT